MIFWGLCICGHTEEEHELGGVCLEPGCLCCMFEPAETDYDTEDAFNDAAGNPLPPNVNDLVQAIQLTTNEWRGNCYHVAYKTLQAGFFRQGRLCYGHWTGPVSPLSIFANRPIIQHGWINLGDGRVADPTRWTITGEFPYVYIGSDEYYDEGGNKLRMEQMTPPPQWSDHEIACPYKLSEGAAALVAQLLHDPLFTTRRTLTIGQRLWLLNLAPAVLEPHAQELYTVADQAGDSALIPIDNKLSHGAHRH